VKVGGGMKKDWSQKEENLWPMAAVGSVQRGEGGVYFQCLILSQRVTCDLYTDVALILHDCQPRYLSHESSSMPNPKAPALSSPKKGLKGCSLHPSSDNSPI